MSADVAHFWDAIARRYDRLYAPTREESRLRLARVAQDLPLRARILDLGVGTGRELPALLDAGHEVIGLDVSAEMLAICSRRARPIKLVHADFWEKLPWDEASFDAVLALHGTLSHPPSTAAIGALALEVGRVLRPGGVFLGEVPSPEWLARAGVAGATGIVTTGPGRGQFVDAATGATIHTTLLSAGEWTKLFAPVMALHAEAIGEDELLLVARRAK